MSVAFLPKRFRRPMPPSLGFQEFRPDETLARWILDVFVAEDGPLANERYAHLRYADIGCLWTMVPNSRHQRAIAAQAEIMPPMGFGKWSKARAEWQLVQWFDTMPDFLLTFDACYAASADEWSWCALVEHELHHCGQEHDGFGAPKFRRNGTPMFAIQGHDVEEFVGVVERYGATAPDVAALVKAANKGPSVVAASLAHACGTCQARRRK